MQKCIRLLTILLFTTAIVHAQTGTIRGFVYEKGTGEPMSYTNVVVQGKSMGVQTDINGYFSIPNLSLGSYTLFTTIIGYDTVTTTAVIQRAEDIISLKLYLTPLDKMLQGVTVNARKTEKLTQTNVGVTTISPREIKLLPSAGGEPDIAQYLQVVPGVIFTGDQGGQLYIRGGAPSQTGILLDGITIYNPFHSIGLYSVFESDAIRNVEVQTAGFSALYGNRTSAILDIRTKDGNKNRLAGKLSASPIMVRGMLEGPIAKSKTEGGSNSTFLLSAKSSYLEQSSKALYGSLGEPYKSGLPYSFTDLYGKVTISGDNGSKLNLFGFSFDDKARVLNNKTKTEDASFHWNAVGAGTTFVVTPGNSAALISGRFAYSKYLIDAIEKNFNSRNSGIDGFEGGIDFTYFLSGYSQLRYGVEVSGFHTSLSYLNSAGTETNLDRRNTLGALFVLYRKNIKEKLILEPSLRIQYYSALSAISPEPRLSMKYNITGNVRMKAAGGIYTQNIISTKSDRDIVNFFNGFLLSPDQEIRNTENERVKTNLQRAYHALLGVEVDIREVELNLEGWYKNFGQAIELSRIKKSTSDGDFTAGSGKAYGIDLSSKYSVGRIFLWGVVSYQKVEYKTLVATNVLEPAKVQTYPPPFDRRWNINLVGSYSAGSKKNWEIAARYNFGSPFPFTQTQGFYENLNPLQNGISTNILQQNGSVGVLYANEINGGRLSYYHRLDLSVKRKFIINKNSNIEGNFSVTNVYDRNNIFYVDRKENERVYQLPLFPSLGLTWNF